MLDGFANQRGAKDVGIVGRDLVRRLETAAFTGLASRMVGLASHFHLAPIIEHFGVAIREAAWRTRASSKRTRYTAGGRTAEGGIVQKTQAAIRPWPGENVARTYE